MSSVCLGNANYNGNTADQGDRASRRCHHRYPRIRAEGLVVLLAGLLSVDDNSANGNQRSSQVHVNHLLPPPRELADEESHTGKYGEDSKLIVGEPPV